MQKPQILAMRLARSSVHLSTPIVRPLNFWITDALVGAIGASSVAKQHVSLAFQRVELRLQRIDACTFVKRWNYDAYAHE